VAADLGTWPAEQATVLLEVLHTAGLHPEARRGRDGVHVTVPDDEGDRAHATLVAQMDTIAKAARPSSPSRGRRLRAVEDPPGSGPKRGGKSGKAKKRKPASSARRPQRSGTKATSRRLGQPAALLVTGFVLAVILGPPTATFVLAVTFGAVVWMLGRQAGSGI
jgi:hypothetical protein